MYVYMYVEGRIQNEGRSYLGMAFCSSTSWYSQSVLAGTGRKPSFMLKHPNWGNHVGQPTKCKSMTYT